LRKCDACRIRGSSLTDLKVKDPIAYQKELSRLRLKNAMRYRVATKFTDVSSSHEMNLRQSARRCAICDEMLTADRHVDHIVPIELGGTHTRDNLRVTCPKCNLSRPRDYSDIGEFQMNLWMGSDASAQRLALHANKRVRIDRTCTECGRPEAVPDSRVWTRDMVCFDCRGKNVRRGPSGKPRKPRPKKMRYDGKHDIDTVVRLRHAGYGYKRIAAHLEISRHQARHLVKRAIAIGLVEA
jgi:5-methylcytosine-specific restriction endonuclease McrA